MPKASTDAVTVYPIGGRFIPGVPAAPISTDEATAARLVASEAFQHEPGPEGDDRQPIELSPAARAALALYVAEV